MNAKVYKYQRNNKSNKANEQCILGIEIKRDNQIIYEKSVLAATETQGKMRAAQALLIEIYGQQKRWLVLVEEISEKVRQDRLIRGVGEKPVVKKLDQIIMPKLVQHNSQEDLNQTLDN